MKLLQVKFGVKCLPKISHANAQRRFKSLQITAAKEYPERVSDPATKKYRRPPGNDKPSPRQKRTAPPASEIPIARQTTGDSSTFYSASSWKELGASDDTIAALAAIGITRPSNIQAAAFRAVSSSAQHVMLAEYAGSGKTLAYLVPLIQKLKNEEAAAGGPLTKPNAPRIVVAVPTNELCNQVLRVCRGLSSTLKFRSSMATGGYPMRTQKDTLREGVDVVIGTPGRLNELINSGDLTFQNNLGLVLDEADILLGDAADFREQMLPMIAAAEGQRDTPGQTLFVTATIPAEIFAEIEESYPGLVVALGPRLHRLAPGVTEQLIDCSGGDEVNEETGSRRKSAALLAALLEKPFPRTIVFCNKIENCRTVENFLNRMLPDSGDEDQKRTWNVLPFHNAIASDHRDATLRQFLATPKPDDANLVLVCTDRASRGVDSTYVDHVVLFDFPRDPSEYVRRVGRTGRGAGGRGFVTVLALGRQVKLAKGIMELNEKARPIHQVPSVLPGANIDV